MALTPRTVFRYFETDGVPASGSHKPAKAEIIQLLEAMQDVSSNPAVVRSTKADLDLITPASEAYGGVVLNDPDPANNGYYYRDSAAWVKGRGFPDSVALLTSVSGSNAITATALPGVNPAEVQVFVLPVAASNTGPVTLSVSGEAPKPVFNRFGSPLGNAELLAGEMVMLVDYGTDYRLLTDSAFQSYFRGSWDGGTDYGRGDLVENGGSIWLALRQNTGVTPVEGDDWTLFLPGVTVADGSVTEPKYATGSVSERALAEDTLRLINGPKSPQVEKWLLTADWQPVPNAGLGVDASPQVIRLRAVMDDIRTYHPDIDYGVLAGDLVDMASDANGATPPYGYPELLSDMCGRLPLPVDRIFMLPGNHDRDAAGLGNWQYSWSYHTYRTHIGPEYYAIKKGNILQIFMGDMAGSNSGEIIQYVYEWFRDILLSHPSYNIIIWTHQPFSGGHLNYTEASNPSGVQRYSERFTDLIASVNNVMFCGYGHVGGTLADAMASKDAFGTKSINFQMGIPSAFHNSRACFYRLMTLEKGQTSITIRSWNADTHEWFSSASDIAVTAKFPIDLGGSGLDFDGRTQVDPYFPVTRGNRAHYQSVAEVRELSGGTWSVPARVHWVDKIMLGDDAGDFISAGVGVGTLYNVPGAASYDTPPDGFRDNAIPAYGPGGGIGFARVNGSQEDYQARGVLVSANTSGTSNRLDEVAEFSSGSHGSADSGFNVLTGNLRVGARQTWDLSLTAAVAGVELSAAGLIRVSRGVTNGYWQRNQSDGQIHEFRRGTTQVGSISVTASATTYNTSSDATLKDDDGALTFDQARSVLDLIAFHNFRWKETGEADEGVFAQELFEVYPKAVTVGGWYREDDDIQQPCGAGDAGARYQPWAVDYSKLVTVIGRCVQGVMERQDDFESRLAALEASADPTPVSTDGNS